MTTHIQNECEYDQQLRSCLDHELSNKVASEVRAHVETCPDCRQAVALMTAVDGELAAWRGAGVPSASLRGRIADAVAKQPDVSARLGMSPARKLAFAGGLAALACAFVVVVLPVLAPSQDMARNIPSTASLRLSGAEYASRAQSMPHTNDKARLALNSKVRSDAEERLSSPLPMSGPVEIPSNAPTDSPSSAPDSITTTVAPPEPGKGFAAIPHEIIYTAEVAITVPKLASGEQNLSRLVAFHRGYIATSNVDAGNGDSPSGSWTVRVPVEQFEGFMSDIAKIGKVVTVHRDSQDVTDEYYDLQAHIANKQIEEARLRDYMQHKSSKLSDMLTLEQELSRVRGEIEEMQGRMRLMGHQADMSTVTITLSESPKPAPKPVKASFGSQMGASFLGSVSGMIDAVKTFAVWFAGMVPNLLLFIALGLLARRFWLRSVAKPVV